MRRECLSKGARGLPRIGHDDVGDTGGGRHRAPADSLVGRREVLGHGYRQYVVHEIDDTHFAAALQSFKLLRSFHMELRGNDESCTFVTPRYRPAQASPSLKQQFRVNAMSTPDYSPMGAARGNVCTPIFRDRRHNVRRPATVEDVETTECIQDDEFYVFGIAREEIFRVCKFNPNNARRGSFMGGCVDQKR